MACHCSHSSFSGPLLWFTLQLLWTTLFIICSCPPYIQISSSISSSFSCLLFLPLPFTHNVVSGSLTIRAKPHRSLQPQKAKAVSNESLFFIHLDDFYLLTFLLRFGRKYWYYSLVCALTMELEPEVSRCQNINCTHLSSVSDIGEVQSSKQIKRQYPPQQQRAHFAAVCQAMQKYPLL